MNRFKKFLLNGAILTVTSVVMRMIGVSFNVYISNTVGAEAMGLFTLISTVYGFALTLATSGISLATTKLVSEELARKDNSTYRSVRGVMRSCIGYGVIFSLLASLLLYFLAEPISISLLRDERCVSSLKLFSLTLLPISLSAVIGGYFTAVRKVYKNAICQVVEQFIRIFASVFLLTRIFAKDVESACICIVAGGTAAEILSFLIRLFGYILDRKKADEKPPERAREQGYRKKLLGISLPLAFSAYVRSALITIEHVLIPRGLEKSGASRELSLAAYGTVQSMVFPIIFFPSALLSSFAGLLVPELSCSSAERDLRCTQRIVSNVFEYSLIFGIGVAGIMTSFSYALGDVIYPATDAGAYIRLIAPLIPIMYLDTAVDSMLKGLGEQVYSMGVNIVDSLLSVILVTVLLPKYAIYGYIMTVYFTETVNSTLSIHRLLKKSRIKPLVIRRVFIPLLSVILSTLISKHLPLSSLMNALPDTAKITLDIAEAAAAYILLLFLFGALRIEKIKKGVSLLKKDKKHHKYYKNIIKSS